MVSLYTRGDWDNDSCRICSSGDKRCSTTFDGAYTVCYSVFREGNRIKQGELGEYCVYLNDPEALEKRKRELGHETDRTAATNTVRPRLYSRSKEEIALIYKVNKMLFQSWELSPAHREYLVKSRGFSNSEIDRLGYRTASNSNEKIGHIIREFQEKLLSVPGFYQVLGKMLFKTNNQLLITTQNATGEIPNFRVVNLDQRTSKNKKYYYVSSYCSKSRSGPKALLEAHVVTPEKIEDNRIWLTEGEFKAHAASNNLKSVFISVPGVSNWNLFFPALESFREKDVVVAFDSDLWTNKTVATNLIALTKKLKEERYNVEIAKW